jgi:hypothetical protein
MRRLAVSMSTPLLATATLLLLLGCASAPSSLQSRHPPLFVPDVTEEEWAAAKVFDKSFMKSPRMLAGVHEVEAVGVLPGERGYAKVASVIRKDGTLGVYRIVTTNNAAFAGAVVAVLRRQRYEPPLLNGEPIALRIDWEYRVSRD